MQEAGGLWVRPRSAAIDRLRGLLIVLVILGHFFELSRAYPLLTWLGSGFRMPLFVGLTGYLFNLDRARSSSLGALLARYWHRLIVPWLVACVVYLLSAGPATWETPFRLIVRPPYHLWFVPVILLFVLATWATTVRPRVLLAAALPVTIAAMIVFGVGHQVEQFHPWMPDRRYFIFPAYFIFGLCVARRPPGRRLLAAAAILAPIGMWWWWMLYRHPSPAAEMVAELTLCLSLICLLPLARAHAIRLPMLAPIGRDSLFFYLWHPMVLGLWIAAGLSGWALIAATAVSLGIAWAGLRQSSPAAQLLGIRPATAAVHRSPSKRHTTYG